jgi:hypothetical protein
MDTVCKTNLGEERARKIKKLKFKSQINNPIKKRLNIFEYENDWPFFNLLLNAV